MAKMDEQANGNEAPMTIDNALVEPSALVESPAEENSTPVEANEQEAVEIPAKEVAAPAKKEPPKEEKYNSIEDVLEGLVPADALEKKTGDEETTTTEEAKDKPPVVANEGATTKIPFKRDYSGLDEDEMKAFKGMPNQAFNALIPRYREYKKAAEVKAQLEQEIKPLREHSLPPEYFRHPEGYKLDTAYGDLTRTISNLDMEKSYIKQQIVRMRNGEQWDLVEFDPSNGKYVNKGKQDPNQEALVDFEEKLQHAIALKASHEEKIRSLQNTFSQQHQVSRDVIRDATDKFFPDYKSVPADSQVAKLMSVVKEALPPSYRNDPISDLLAKAYAKIGELNDKLAKSVVAEKKVAQTAATKQKVGPSMRTISAAPSNGKVPGESDYDFQRDYLNIVRGE